MRSLKASFRSYHHMDCKMTAPYIKCTGNPYEIGFTHGSLARSRVADSIAFYEQYFQEMAQVSWKEVQGIAQQFQPTIEKKWPDLFEEITGVADGAEKPVEDILALNVRTEIAFGLQKYPQDGCTALYWNDPKSKNQPAFLAQNWDWKEKQGEALVVLDVNPKDAPDFKIVTEAGIIGKIGFNEYGVGCCLNAISALGMDTTKIPVHLALRMAMTFHSAEKAADYLQREMGGCASAASILVADDKSAIGLEFSYADTQRLEPDSTGRLYHTNHYLLSHQTKSGESINDPWQPKDSEFRLKRIEQLANKMSPTLESVQSAFRDKENYPGSICRKNIGEVESSTIFNIVMDLKGRKGEVIIGDPSKPEDTQTISLVE